VSGGYRPSRRTFRLRFEDDQYDGLVVKVRSTSVGRLLEVMELLALDIEALTAEDVQRFAGVFDALAEVLVEWNVEDDVGQPVPATLDGIKHQDIDFVMDILMVWFQALVQAPAPLPATSSAGGPSAVPPLPMEPLSPSRAS